MKKKQNEKLYRNIKEMLARAFQKAEAIKKNIYIYESLEEANAYFMTISTWHKMGKKIGTVYPAKLNKRTEKKESFALLLGVRFEHEKRASYEFPEEKIAGVMQAKNVEKIISSKWPEMLADRK